MNPQNLDAFKYQETLKAFSRLHKLIHEKVYTAKEFNGATYRNISHWGLKGLLLDDREENKGWNYFNFIDVIWFRIFRQLREFGLPLPLLKKIKSKLLVQFDVMEMADLSDVKINEKTKQHLDEKAKHIKTKVTKEISGKTLDELPFEIVTKFSLLANAIIEFVIWRNHLNFLINVKGEVFLWNEHETQYYIDAGIDVKRKHHISISLPQLMSDFILGDKKDEKYPRLGIITEQESEVLKLLRKKEIKTLTIRLKDEKINLIEATETYNTVDVASRFMEHILRDGYQNISFTTQKGKIVSFEKVTKHKI